MIEDKYYKPVEEELFEQHVNDHEVANTGRTEEFPSEMAKRHAKEWEALRTQRVALNHIQWFQLYPYSRIQEQERTASQMLR
jgi:hypothetical protein